VLEITAALSAVNKIVTEDMIPAVIGDVSALPAGIRYGSYFLQTLCALAFAFHFHVCGCVVICIYIWRLYTASFSAFLHTFPSPFSPGGNLCASTHSGAEVAAARDGGCAQEGRGRHAQVRRRLSLYVRNSAAVSDTVV
jgi:hypothetical protein